MPKLQHVFHRIFYFQLLSLCRHVQLSIFITANEHERKPWCGDKQLDRCHMKHSEDDYPSQCGDMWHVLDSSDTLENMHQEVQPASQQSALQTTASQNNVGTKMCTSSIVFARWHQTIVSAVFAQLTAERLYTLQWVPLSQKLPVPIRGSGPASNTLFLGPIQAQNPSSTLLVQPSLHRWPKSVPILYNRMPFPLKIAPFHGVSEPHLNTWFLGRPKSSTQTASRLVQPFLQGSLEWQTGRQNDRQTMQLGR